MPPLRCTGLECPGGALSCPGYLALLAVVSGGAAARKLRLWLPIPL